jgi:hypothetical protein
MSQNDHYISQTYLNAFTDKEGMLIPYYKNGRVIIGKKKSTSAVCYEKDGDENSYFVDARIVDEYLRLFENNWANHVHALEEMSGDQDTKYGIAGYIAFLRTCNPTAKRLGQSLLTDTIQPVADRIMAESADDPETPPEIKELYKKHTEDKNIEITVDPEYAHAKGISTLVDITHKLYCSKWLILFNNTDTPFLTSDNPAVLYYRRRASQIANTFVPLTPKLGVLISPNPSAEVPTLEKLKTYEHGDDQIAEIKEKFAHKFNELIVKPAENIVIHRASEEWVEILVRNNKTWRTELITSNIPYGRGLLMISRQQAIDTENS